MDDKRFNAVPKLGGARRGAGRKAEKAGEDDFKVYAAARARLEVAKANLAELNFKIASGQYIERAAVREASATAFARCAQAIRSIPDNLERKLSISPDLAQRIEDEVHITLASLSEALAKHGHR
jgi:phage terminase Nu1 subunit (DNA packaging protein)